MGFVKTSEEIIRYQKNAEFYDAEVLLVYFETTQDVVKRLLPPPLEPTASPVGSVFIANYPRTNMGISYLESALFLSTQHKGEEGAFCLAMPVTDDTALILGREVFGYPKKMAKIGFEHKGNDVFGWTERRDIRFFEAKAKLTGKFNDTIAQKMITESMTISPDIVNYNFKYFTAPETDAFDYNPRLNKGVVTRNVKSIEMGEAELILRPSEHDPWYDVEIVRVLGAMYTIADYTMLPGSVVADVDQMEFMPYALMKLDVLR